MAQQGAPFGATCLAIAEPRFQLTKALCADFLSHLIRKVLSEPGEEAPFGAKKKACLTNGQPGRNWSDKN